MRKAFLVPVALALSTLSQAGCGSSNGLYPVQGKVLYKGEPATGALVYFHQEGNHNQLHDQASMGVVGEDGTFTLAGPGGDGAMPGKYVVLVEWKEGAGKTRGRSPGLSAPDRLKGRYLSASKPLLHAEVKATSNRLPAFELN